MSKRSGFLPFAPPCLSEREVTAVVDVLHKDWLSSGPKTKEFEESFKKYVGADSALALNSCTAGLHLAMILHRVGPGTEVITTPMTFCATANVVEHRQARVVFADIDPDTFLIDAKEIEKHISKKTRVIVPVHYAGQPCDMDTINGMAKAVGAAVVEDAAHCMPSKIGGRFVGAGGNLTAFSFYANKNMTTGEGGMLTGPHALIDEARMLALHGMSRNAWDRFSKGASWKYDVVEPGYKYNLSEAAAVIGLVQLQRLEELYAKRVAVVEFYENAFRGNGFLRPLKLRAGVQSSRHLYVIQLQLEKLSIGRDEFVNELTERNIGTSVHYIPLHMMTYYAKKYGWKPEAFPNAFKVSQGILSLPLNSRMTTRDAADVVSAIEDVCLKFKR